MTIRRLFCAVLLLCALASANTSYPAAHAVCAAQSNGTIRDLTINVTIEADSTAVVIISMANGATLTVSSIADGGSSTYSERHAVYAGTGGAPKVFFWGTDVNAAHAASSVTVHMTGGADARFVGCVVNYAGASQYGSGFSQSTVNSATQSSGRQLVSANGVAICAFSIAGSGTAAPSVGTLEAQASSGSSGTTLVVADVTGPTAGQFVTATVTWPSSLNTSKVAFELESPSAAPPQPVRRRRSSD